MLKYFKFLYLFLVLELKQVIIPTYGTVPDQPNLHTPEWVGTFTMTTCNFFSYATVSSCSRRPAFLCICSICSSSVLLNLSCCISLSLKVPEVMPSDVKVQVDMGTGLN